MDMPAIDLESIVEKHQCGYPTNDWVDMKGLRRGVEAHCPTCRLTSACIDWAVPALLAYTDIFFAWATPAGTVILAGEHHQELCFLELFLLDSERIDHLNIGSTNIYRSD